MPRVCIGAGGEQIGLPMVGRLADMWNGWYRGDDDWNRRIGIVRTSAEKAGRDPDAIEVSNTIEKALPETDEESEQLLELLRHRQSLGISHFVMDFGHPQSTEPVLRFVEQVMNPLRGPLMELDVRLTEPHELRAAADAARHGLLFPPTGDDDWEKWGHGWVDDHVSVERMGRRPVRRPRWLDRDSTTKVPGGAMAAHRGHHPCRRATHPHPPRRAHPHDAPAAAGGTAPGQGAQQPPGQ